MMISFDDIHQLVPADLSDDDARAYENKILELVREGMSNSAEVESIAMRGSRPETEIIFQLKEPDHAGRVELAYRLWHASFDNWSIGQLDGPASVAGWAIAAWHASELEQPRHI